MRPNHRLTMHTTSCMEQNSAKKQSLQASPAPRFVPKCLCLCSEGHGRGKSAWQHEHPATSLPNNLHLRLVSASFLSSISRMIHKTYMLRFYCFLSISMIKTCRQSTKSVQAWSEQASIDTLVHPAKGLEQSFVAHTRTTRIALQRSLPDRTVRGRSATAKLIK